MLDDEVVKFINHTKGKENKIRRKDTGWQPIPLHIEVDFPPEAPAPEEEKSPSGPIKIDIWGPEADDNIIQTLPYSTFSYDVFPKYHY